MKLMIQNNNIISNNYYFYDADTKDPISAPLTLGLTDACEIDYVIDCNGKKYSKGMFVYTNLVLDVPGLGPALCGDLITLKVKNKISEFTLGFGWHVNISNQKLYSWYLLPLDDYLNTPDIEFKKAKSLYYDDLINIVGVTRQMPGILPTDIA